MARSSEWKRIANSPFERGPRGLILFGMPTLLFLIALIWITHSHCHWEPEKTFVCEDGDNIVVVAIGLLLFTGLLIGQICVNVRGKPFSRESLEQGLYEPVEDEEQPVPPYQS